MSTRTQSVGLVMIVSSCAWAQSAQSQSLAQRLGSVSDGAARFAFATREGICGQGNNITHVRSQDRYWEPTCDSGPTRVVVEFHEGAPVRLRVHIGGHWLDDARVSDLGMVDVVAATDYLLDLAETAAPSVAERAAFAATLADSVEVWRRLLEIASDPNRSTSVRRRVQQQLGMLAAEMLRPDDASSIDPEREVREQAVFALSQLPRDQGIPRLVEIATNHPLSYIRGRALFWLGQSGDPRALDAIADVLSAAKNP